MRFLFARKSPLFTHNVCTCFWPDIAEQRLSFMSLVREMACQWLKLFFMPAFRVWFMDMRSMVCPGTMQIHGSDIIRWNSVILFIISVFLTPARNPAPVRLSPIHRIFHSGTIAVCISEGSTADKAAVRSAGISCHWTIRLYCWWYPVFPILPDLSNMPENRDIRWLIFWSDH